MCGTSSCPFCDDCVPACRPHGCRSELRPVCDLARPECPEGQVSRIWQGCWECVDRDTCEAVEPTDCELAGGYCTLGALGCRRGFMDGGPMDCPGGRGAQCCLPDAECQAGDLRPFECPDGSLVDWCRCEAGRWACVDSPEALCRDTHCDDGVPLRCRIAVPECLPWEILAHQDGCYACVNPLTCHPWGEPGCRADADCPAGAACDPCGTSSCPRCDDCVAACAPHGCPTEPRAECDLPRPECAEGQVAIINDGCWLCVDEQTCRPPEPTECEAAGGRCGLVQRPCPDGFSAGGALGCPGGRSAQCCLPDECREGDERRFECPGGEQVDWCRCREGRWSCIRSPETQCRDTQCDDGTVPVCDLIPPVCGEFEIFAHQDDCYRCVNPVTCLPWGAAGCREDRQCPPDEACDPCATSSCPLCEDCVAACQPHGCPTEGQLECRCVRPQCERGQVAVILDGCWVCVTEDTCRPVARGCDEELPGLPQQ